MRRILLLVTVAAVMAAMVALGSSAMAAPGGQGDEHRAMPRETGGTPSDPPPLDESAPTSDPHGYFERPESVDELGKGRRTPTGPKSE